MAKRVLLINPWIHDFAAFDLWSMPLGLLSVAAFLQRNGHVVDLIDCLDASRDLRKETGITLPRHRGNGTGTFARQVIEKPEIFHDIPRYYARYGIPPALFRGDLQRTPRPDMVFVTSLMTYWYPGVFEAIRIVREVFPGVPVILGGIYATLCPDHAMHSGADLVLAGPGETEVPRRLGDLFGGEWTFLPDMEDPDSLPCPAVELAANAGRAAVLASRGCPLHCTYCASSLLSPRYIRRHPIRVVDEIEFRCRTQGVRHFAFYDDALFMTPEELILPMLREILRRDLRAQFHCPNGLHLHAMTPELAVLMRNAGFRTLRFGFESSDEERQRRTGGKTDNGQLAAAVRCLKKAGYDGREIGVYILCGLPGQEPDEIAESIRFVRGCGARPILAEYAPIPGTTLWPEAVRSSPYPIAEEPLCHNNTLMPCRVPALTRERYRELQAATKAAE